MLQKKKKKKKKRGKEGPNKRTVRQTDRQGSKRFQLSQFCCVLSEIKNGREI
jgi:hypothetical protein